MRICVSHFIIFFEYALLKAVLFTFSVEKFAGLEENNVNVITSVTDLYDAVSDPVISNTILERSEIQGQ